MIPGLPCANHGQGLETPTLTAMFDAGHAPGFTPTFYKEALPGAPCSTHGQGHGASSLLPPTAYGSGPGPTYVSTRGVMDLVFAVSSFREALLKQGTLLGQGTPGISTTTRFVPPPDFSSTGMPGDGMAKVSPPVVSLLDP